MRTHARYEAQRAAAAAAVASQAVAAAAAVVNDPASIDGSRMSFAQMQRNLLAGANLSEVNIKMEDDATTSVSPRTLSPAYGPTACIKTENICSWLLCSNSTTAAAASSAYIYHANVFEYESLFTFTIFWYHGILL